MGGRRAGPAGRLRGDHRDARVWRAPAHADGLLRPGRVLRPALGRRSGQRAVRKPAPGAVPVVTAGAVTDGPGRGARAGTQAGADDTGPVTRAGISARARRHGARGPAGSGAHARAGAGLEAPGAALAVASPMDTAAMAAGRRGLVPPLTLVAGPAFAPASLVVRSGRPGPYSDVED